MVSKKTSYQIEAEDLVGPGIIGLINSIERFDPSQKVYPKTFLACRIRGAMLDELRNIDWVPRQSRGRIRETNRVINEHLCREEKIPTIDDLKEETGYKEDELFERKNICFQDMVVMKGSGARNTPWEETLRDNKIPLPDDVAIKNEFWEKNLRGLSAMDQVLMREYYINERPFSVIAEMVGLSESRMSQIHNRIIRQLKESRGLIDVQWSEPDQTEEELEGSRGKHIFNCLNCGKLATRYPKGKSGHRFVKFCSRKCGCEYRWAGKNMNIKPAFICPICKLSKKPNRPTCEICSKRKEYELEKTR